MKTGQILFSFLILSSTFAASFSPTDPHRRQRDCADALSRLFEDFSAAKIYSEMANLQKRSKGRSLGKMAGDWLSRMDVGVDLKARFLMAQIGSGHGDFERYLKFLSESDQEEVWKEIQRGTSFALFRNLARELEVPKALFDRGVLESFQFKGGKEFPNGKKSEGKVFKMGKDGQWKVTLTKQLEMQATPVTQLQYALIMGENPSSFVSEGMRVRIGGKDMWIDPNRPVEGVSWRDAHKFIKRINKLQTRYIYRLPSEAEWVFAARGGMLTRYWFGDDAREIRRFAWFDKNSRRETRPVGLLSPNPFGLHEVHGNVWEWTQDVFALLPKGEAKNPVQKGPGVNRVLRGGSWHSMAHFLDFGFRNYAPPEEKARDYGFRLARRRRL